MNALALEMLNGVAYQPSFDIFDLDWVAEKVLNDAAFAKYNKASNAAWVEYKMTIARLRIEFEETQARAWSEYKKIQARAFVNAVLEVY